MILKRIFLLPSMTILFACTIFGFELPERIYPADIDTELRFTAKSEWAKKNLNVVRVGYVRDDSRFMNSDKPQRNGYENLPVRIDGNDLVVRARLRGEHRHTFLLTVPAEKGKKPEKRAIAVLTLGPELFRLRPFKGNTHQHSNVSDGKYSPEEHVAWARHAGFDFVSVTDHGKHTQNNRALAAAGESGSGLRVYVGEEMHSPQGVLHSIALGAPQALSRPRSAEFQAEIKPLLDRLKKEHPEVDAAELLFLAESLNRVETAHKAGAMVVYCHPQWMRLHRLNAFPFYNDYLLRHGNFDAVEIVNGPLDQPNHNHNLVHAGKLYELAAETGKKIPVVAGSDCHDVKRSWYYPHVFNIIFAPDASFDSFRSAVKEFRSVAAAGTKKDKYYFGPSQFIAYAYFLDEIGFWQDHDKLARRQAELLIRYLNGEKTVKPEIERLAGEINAAREKFFFRADNLRKENPATPRLKK